MAWGYPTAKFSQDLVLSIEDINANIRGAATEIDGGLNEHNIKNDALYELVFTNDVGDDDLFMRLFQTYNEVDPHAAVGTQIAVPFETRWFPISESEVEFTVPRGKIYTCCSFQQRSTSPAAAQSGLNFCLLLNGVPQMNSLLGTGDHGNEYMDETVAISTSYFSVTFGTSPSFRSAQEHHVVSGVYTVPAGTHTVHLGTRNLFTNVAAPTQYLSQIETLVFFLWDE